MSYRVGLTGGIGCGKSTIATIFAEHGVPIIDTDKISHQITQKDGAAIPAIKSEFGEKHINEKGALDRTTMRQLVFSDSSARQGLEKILHPLILTQVKTQAESCSAPYALIVIPLLFESSGYQDWLDRTLTVDCTDKTQIERASGREGMNEQMVRSIMAQQFSRLKRIELADDVIENNGSLSDLQPQISKLHQQYLKLAQLSN